MKEAAERGFRVSAGVRAVRLRTRDWGQSPEGDRWWEIAHLFVARLVGQVIKTPTQDAWTRLKPVLYPSSMILWAAGTIALIAFYPWIERNRAEENLRSKYHFAVDSSEAGFSLTQTDNSFTDLVGARLLLLKVGRLLELKLAGCKGLSGLQGAGKGIGRKGQCEPILKLL
jgi:hypothetical protein